MSTGLVATKTDRSDLIVSGQEWACLKEQCKMLVDSGFLPQAIKKVEQAMAIALKGRELGIPPMQAFAQINIIQGKPAISAELMLALIYRNVPGTKIEYQRLEKDGCHILATRPGHKPALFKFEMADAKAAGLDGKDNWKKWPRAMFRSRAISEMARSQFADAIMGCSYTPEELGAEVDEEGEVINVTPIKPEAPATPPPGAGMHMRVDKSIKAFAEIGVTRQQIEKRYGKAANTFGDAELTELRTIYGTLRDDPKADVSNWFEQVSKPATDASNDVHKSAPEMAQEKKAAIASFEARVAEVRAAGCESVEDVIGMTINEALLLPAPRLEAAVDMLNLWLKA